MTWLVLNIRGLCIRIIWLTLHFQVHSPSKQGRETKSPPCHCSHLQFYKTTLQNLVWLKFVVYYRSECERRMSGHFMDIMQQCKSPKLISTARCSYQVGFVMSGSKACQPVAQVKMVLIKILHLDFFIYTQVVSQCKYSRQT
jgi:hypothetical protein